MDVKLFARVVAVAGCVIIAVGIVTDSLAFIIGGAALALGGIFIDRLVGRR